MPSRRGEFLVSGVFCSFLLLISCFKVITRPVNTSLPQDHLTAVLRPAQEISCTMYL